MTIPEGDATYGISMPVPLKEYFQYSTFPVDYNQMHTMSQQASRDEIQVRPMR